MLSKNCFLDIMADVKLDYVEEVLFMPQFAQDNKELEKYRKKSSFWKVFGSIAACVAVIGVGAAVLMLHNSGLLTTPEENTATEVMGVTTQDPNFLLYQADLRKSLYSAINRIDTFEAMFREFDMLDTEKKITKVVVYQNKELLDQNVPMKEEELTDLIPEGAIIHVYFSETDFIQFEKKYDNSNDYEELITALCTALNNCSTFEEMFEAFDEIDKNGMIVEIRVYKNAELHEQGITMKEEELKGAIPNGTDIFVYFGESGYKGMDMIFGKSELPEGVVLQGLAGDNITSEDISDVSYNNSENPDVWSMVKCEGFCYLSEPAGYCFNSIDNPNLVDLSTGDINGGVMPAREIKRYYVGDEICGLKVKSASFSLMNMYGDNDHPDGCRAFNSVSFEGAVELTGYLWINDDGISMFIPDNESGKKLPVLSTPFERHYSFGSVGDDFGYSWENPVIECETVTGLNTDNMEKNKPIKIYVTLTDFSLGFSQGAPVDSFADGKITLKALP